MGVDGGIGGAVGSISVGCPDVDNDGVGKLWRPEAVTVHRSPVGLLNRRPGAQQQAIQKQRGEQESRTYSHFTMEYLGLRPLIFSGAMSTMSRLASVRGIATRV